jgi:putative transposase
LGDDHFVQQMQDCADRAAKRRQQVPKRQRAKPKTLAQWLATSDSREAALRSAYVQSGITMSAMAVELGMSVARISQLIARAKTASTLAIHAKPTTPQ